MQLTKSVYHEKNRTTQTKVLPLFDWPPETTQELLQRCSLKAFDARRQAKRVHRCSFCKERLQGSYTYARGIRSCWICDRMAFDFCSALYRQDPRDMGARG